MRAMHRWPPPTLNTYLCIQLIITHLYVYLELCCSLEVSSISDSEPEQADIGRSHIGSIHVTLNRLVQVVWPPLITTTAGDISYCAAFLTHLRRRLASVRNFPLLFNLNSVKWFTSEQFDGDRRTSRRQQQRQQTMDSQTAQKLAQMSRDVLCHSYSPYSSFPVGAALLCEDGSIYTGVNIETATLLGLCAERCAYVKALSEGHRKFKAVAVSSNLTGACPPCGTCRQFMAEVS